MPAPARITPLIVALPLTLAQAACDDAGSKCDPVEPSVALIGPELFAVDYGAAPGSAALFRYGEQVQLLEGAREQPVREVRATLSAEAIASIEAAEAAIGSGGELGSFDQQCLTFLDQPGVELSLGVLHASLSFRYPWGCPPSGLAELDAALRELVISLPTCSPTPLVIDCELIGE